MLLIAYAAPIAAFRDFTAGFERPSLPFAPPSALYGLLLNIAGIETRDSLGPGPTATRAGLPSFRIASAARAARNDDHSFAGLVGQGRWPGKGRLFQHQHTVPVGEVSKKHKPMTKGNKHHIALASRGLLTTFCGVCAVDADPTLETLLTTQLDAPSPKLSCGSPRYGLPFLGDNNFFLEELSLIKPDPTEVDWLVNEKGPAPFRLTVAVDRAGISNTRQRDFTLQPGPLHSPPPSAWVQVGPRP